MFKNKHNFAPNDFIPEVHGNLSMTVPGMAIDISDAVERLRIGQNVKSYVPAWTSEHIDLVGAEELLEFEQMDKFDKLVWAAETRQKIKDLQNKIQKATTKAEQSKKDQTEPPKGSPEKE